MFESNEGSADPGKSHDASPADLAYWRQLADEAESALSRLAKRLRARDQRIALLEQALARDAVLHHVWAKHLEHRVERIPSRMKFAVRLPSDTEQSSVTPSKDGISIQLPHLTPTLSALIDVMWTYWSDWDADRPPKSSVVARAIDEKLGLKGQANGEASRNAQTFAAALRPESVNEADGRHR